MPGSKTALKKCKYVFIQGSKKGKKCNAKCKNEYCKRHNNVQLEYQKKYYAENIKLPVDKIIEQNTARISSITDIRNITFKTTERERIKANDAHDKVIDIAKKILGIKIFLDEISELDVYQPMIQKLYNNEEISKEDFEQSKEVTLFENLPLNIYDKLDHKKFYIEYSGNKNKEHITKLKNELIDKKKVLLDNYKIQKAKYDAYRKCRTELLKKRTEIKDSKNND